ncbi:MAG: Swt1 family HEPN domain-containing protein [Candidatus Hydrogenedentota bacterium]
MGEGLELLRTGLYPFMERELEAHYGADWRQQAAQSLRFQTKDEEWDIAAILTVLSSEWHNVFKDVLSNTERTLAFELRDVRNDWAHQKGFSTDDAYRALDSMARLLTAVNAGDEALACDKMKGEVLRLKFHEQTRTDARRRASQATEGAPAAGLTPWRDVIAPHPDVASGNYLNAEFAADLYQVWSNIAAPEYGDPFEFFRRTYLTQGLRGLLSNGVKRLSGEGGDPVLALQTNFGGGKTHSLLALYHLFAPDLDVGSLPHVDEVLSELGKKALPQVRRAVIVGPQLKPSTGQTMDDGTQVRTMWGSLAWQLAGKEGYELVRAADETSSNPGSDLAKLFEMAGPSLILIDEWVAYARGLYNVENLAGGSFDTQFTFAQALTEAVSASKNTLLVVSIPASDIEKGGRAGLEASNRLEHVVGRKEATWQPASTEEGFEIVRRRLFQPITDPETYRRRDAVVRAFLDVYRASNRDFPAACASAEYEQRMRSAYPIHPEVFDQLYNVWSTLDRFQRTRGVLRLMAAVIHELWERGDPNLMILPGMLPMDDPDARRELTQHLEETWQAVVERDVDGPESTPLTIDQENTNLGRYSAARRVARTVFLGTAPLKGSANRGRDIRQINLGCVQPGESLATFGDALRRLQSRATYLNTDGERSFYDTTPNINREAESRKADFDDETVREEIRKTLKRQEQRRGDFMKVHACPYSPSDISDEREARLVILGPEHVHLSGREDSPAIEQARHLLETRGSGPRLYRNSLLFVAPDRTRLVELEDAVRWAMAWRAIDEHAEDLNLDTFNRRTAAKMRGEWENTIEQRLPETYRWLLVPGQPDTHGPIEWNARPVSGDGALAERASKRMKQDETLITQLGAVRLRLELDRVPLWRNGDVEVKQLADYFAQYVYLPRLQGPHVLARSIEEGLGLLSWREDTFAYAERKDPDTGRYQGLRTGESVTLDVTSGGLLVKPEIARAQREEEEQLREEQHAGTSTAPAGKTTVAREDDPSVSSVPPGSEAPAEPRPVRRFYGRVELDPDRVGRDAGRIAHEILAHLLALKGAKVTVNLEIQAETEKGFDSQTMRTVSENCRTLKFESHGFEEQ